MATFPKLKTNAVAQYPATKGLRFQNQVLRFVDGTEQRYRDAPGPLHQWAIRLSQLDEGEMAAMERFFAANQGRFGSFAFTDPWDNSQYANCSLAGDGMDLTAVGPLQGNTTLTVVENRV
jgi:hypothetical protein